MCRRPWASSRGFDGAGAYALRVVELAEHQSGTTQPVVGCPDDADVSPSCVTLEKLLALPESGERLARLPDLREDPGGSGDRPGELEADVPGPDHRDPVLDQ